MQIDLFQSVIHEGVGTFTRSSTTCIINDKGRKDYLNARTSRKYQTLFEAGRLATMIGVEE